MSFYDTLKKYNILEKVIEFANANNWDSQKVFEFIKNECPDFPIQNFKGWKALYNFRKKLQGQEQKEENLDIIKENKENTIDVEKVKDIIEKIDYKSSESFFALLSENIDKILDLKLSPQGAMLQNTLKGCLLRLKELESGNDEKKDVSIVKYVGEIRALVEQISKEYKEQILNQKYIQTIVQKEVSIILEAVKEVVIEIMPQEIENFSNKLSKKIINLRNNDNSEK
jgi:hypothetical protein